MRLQFSFLGIALFFSTATINAQNIITQYSPDGYTTISEGVGGFNADVDGGDRFSRDHNVIGDLDGDGVLDMVIGARSDDDVATDAGAVYIVFMNADGTVKSNQKISGAVGGFNETLTENSFFGYSVAGIGDYNGDGIPDIAVATLLRNNSAIYIIYLNTDGTVKGYVKNDNIAAQGLTAADMNDDGKMDLIVGDAGADDGGTNRGAVHILFFDENSEVIPNETVTISSTQGGFGTGLSDQDAFGGRETIVLGDIDGDGTKELAVGAFRSNGGKGSIWILSLDPNTLQVTSKVNITEGVGGFDAELVGDENPNGSLGANFGHAMCAPGDLNGDGIPDLITGANQQEEGKLFILYLNADKTLKTYTRIDNENGGGFDLALQAEERFSRSMSFFGDLRGDGSIAVNVGGGATGLGALYVLFFKPCGFEAITGNNFYTGGTTLFSNWSHNDQLVTEPLTFEQCSAKVFETEATYMTFNPADGRCICKNQDAQLADSVEESSAFIKNCDAILSTDSFNMEEAFQVFPNPAHTELHIHSEAFTKTTNSKVAIYAIDGQLMKMTSLVGTTFNTDISSFAPGMYFAIITSSNKKSKQLKFIKQ